ncbi:MAG TPA: ferric reductase-like transmembrane domain-containing protein [Gemmatimonadaceae bacterium]|nr:ferric reductase-like transmembrane domain-containing protein [Gemmatimonadaceae bacterium]
MSALELSSDVGIVAVFVLTFNILLGLLMGVKYNPWRSWPHRRINYFKIHNWTGYVALALSVLHVILLLLSTEANFRVVDVLYPMVGPKQPVINTLGAAALYVLIVVVTTSYFRAAIGHDRWRIIHYGTYLTATLFLIHGIWSDPSLKDRPIDYLDAEKVGIELCLLIVIAGSFFRWRTAMRRRKLAGARQRRYVPPRDASPAS